MSYWRGEAKCTNTRVGAVGRYDAAHHVSDLPCKLETSTPTFRVTGIPAAVNCLLDIGIGDAKLVRQKKGHDAPCQGWRICMPVLRYGHCHQREMGDLGGRLFTGLLEIKDPEQQPITRTNVLLGLKAVGSNLWVGKHRWK